MWKQNQDWEEERRNRFIINGKEVVSVEKFKYLGRMITDQNEDWLEMESNIQ